MTSILALWTGVLVALGGPVREVRIAPTARTTDVVIAMDGPVEYRDFIMEGPTRLVVDLMGAELGGSEREFSDIRRGGIRSMRISQYSEDLVRVTVELEENLPYQITTSGAQLRISLERRTPAFEPWSRSVSSAPAQRSRPVSPSVPQEQTVVRSAPISVEFDGASIEDVLFTFAEFSGRSIVKGESVTANISARIDNQPWDEALDVILSTNGFVATELPSGIIRVDDITSLNERESVEPPYTRTYRINYATAEELATAVEGLVTDRGSVSFASGSNALIVSDVPRVHRDVEDLIRSVDIRTPQVSIQAKIIFVNRTDLNELGITYDLKDSDGNQLNLITPGAVDLNNDGVIELPEEQAQQGTNVVSLGGNSFAALGNANQRVVSPTLTLLSSLVIGRHTLVNFIDVLASRNLSDIQAQPSVTVLDNQQARIQVGERTPLRVIDASSTVGGAGQGGQAGGAGAAAGGAGGAIVPQATVNFEETGIILTATPHVTDNNNILLELEAERSAPVLGESDVGLIFQTQEASSRVLVRDGETVVIAGLTVTETNELQTGIPFLMDLPLIGGLFRTTRQQQTQRDLIILVTPNIVRDLGN
ncbi:MAG: AMIN domain-containing protein [Gemmatimonadales bacterium]|jgi:type IV pilus assembly protein PilQ|nr:MAG: AMIN domain-containing protein [Gemmatimonadales bacterium]